MHHIVIQYAVPKKIPGSVLLKRWANAALGKKKPAEVTIRIVDVAEMTNLNTTYRKKKGPTNVLAFPFDTLETHDKNHHRILGDIVICAEIVEHEALEQNKKSRAHWAHMVVHGILHLQGHDHIIEKDAIIMEAKETRILKALGFPNPYKL